MKKFLAAIMMTGLAGSALAQSSTMTDANAPKAAGSTAAAEASMGSLTPLYIGAGLVGAAVISAGVSGGGSSHGNSNTSPGTGGGGNGGTGGTTGTTGTH